MQASEAEAKRAIAILERAIHAAKNGNQAGENAVVKAAAAISKPVIIKEPAHAG